MKIRTLLCLGVLAPIAFISEHARADCPQLNHEIKGTAKSSVGVFDENGTLLREAPKAEVLNKTVVACNESYGLVKISQADGKSLWLDAAELTIPGALTTSSSVVCVAKNNAAPADKRQVVSSGAGPKGSCDSPAK